MIGLIISFVSFLICFYTCSLIIFTAKNDKDYVFTLRKYYGNWGWYLGLIGPALLIFGALVAYFNVIVTNIYSVLYYFLVKVAKMDIKYISIDPNPFKNFDKFSPAWMSVVMYFILVPVSLKKDLSIFIKMGSFGSFCCTILILYVIYTGFKSLNNTTFEIENNSPPIGKIEPTAKELYLFNTGFNKIAGILNTGYFIH